MAKRALTNAAPLEVTKTYKLFINGAFPRTESGRSLVIHSRNSTQANPVVFAHTCHASRKDLRESVEAARAALPKWSSTAPYTRGQILYRLAEMMQGKAAELADALEHVASTSSSTNPALKSSTKVTTSVRSNARTTMRAIAHTNQATSSRTLSPRDEVSLAIDTVVHHAGWADKLAQVLGTNNPVSGPYYNFTIPEPVGVTACIAPDAPPLLGLVSLLAPALATGSTTIVIASDANPIPACILAEACATSDIPAGVVNILTGLRDELLTHIAQHRDIDAILAASPSPANAAIIRTGVAESIKRVSIFEPADWKASRATHGLSWIEPSVEYKTIWHPSAV